MKKILIVTHSSDDGINYEICKLIRDHLEKSFDSIILNNPTLLNSDQLLSNEGTHIYEKIIFVIPEWNGSIPWTFKKMIDDSGWPSNFKNSNIVLIGTSNTTFGNLMGINHMSHILEFCGASVTQKKVYVPKVGESLQRQTDVIVFQSYLDSIFNH